MEKQHPLQYGCEDNWMWDRRHKSHEVQLYGGARPLVAHFHPTWSNGTAGVRGTRVLNGGGSFYWEVEVSQRIFGTSMMFGIATKKSRLHAQTYTDLLGEDEHSWGLSHKGLLWHNGNCWHYTRPFRENKAATIGLYFNGHQGTLSYFKDGVDLGVAFEGLYEVNEPLFPVVCSTAAKTEMTLGVMRRSFVNLQDRCRATILKQLHDHEEVESLNLPNRMKSYLLTASVAGRSHCNSNTQKRSSVNSCNYI